MGLVLIVIAAVALALDKFKKYNARKTLLYWTYLLIFGMTLGYFCNLVWLYIIGGSVNPFVFIPDMIKHLLSGTNSSLL